MVNNSVLTKRITTSNLKSLDIKKTTTYMYAVWNPGAGMIQVHMCGGVKPITGILESQPSPCMWNPRIPTLLVYVES